MLKTIIIDDDPLARKGLRHILEINFPEVEIIEEADSVENGLNILKTCEPDLVFLDIEMPDGTGFNLLNDIENFKFKVVFTTSYTDYKITASKYSAFDYVVKPVRIENVREILNRINNIPS